MKYGEVIPVHRSSCNLSTRRLAILARFADRASQSVRYLLKAVVEHPLVITVSSASELQRFVDRQTTLIPPLRRSTLSQGLAGRGGTENYVLLPIPDLFQISDITATRLVSYAPTSRKQSSKRKRSSGSSRDRPVRNSILLNRYNSDWR